MLYCKKQTGGEPLIDIQKDIRELSAMGLMEKLLADKTTGRHILWATDAYETEGEAYGRGREIELAEISLVKTRARKAAEQQSSRTRRHGEVFTPRWVCDFMNESPAERHPIWPSAMMYRRGKKSKFLPAADCLIGSSLRFRTLRRRERTGSTGHSARWKQRMAMSFRETIS